MGIAFFRAIFLAAAALAASGHASQPNPQQQAKPPWQTNSPIVTVRRELYQRHPNPRTAVLVAVSYVGPKLELLEWRSTETKDDVWDDNIIRWSHDNGRTWSGFIKRSASTNVDYGGVTVWESGSCNRYHPASGRFVEMWLRQIQVGPIYHNYTYVRTSPDLGHSWTEPEQLRYEEGDSFDPAQPLKPSFLRANECLPNSILVRHDGALVCAVAHANAEHDPENATRPWKMGGLCFIGSWDAKVGKYQWTAGKRTEISPQVSARGLMEPDVAELDDRRLLVVWRGSNTPTTAGRKWFSISSDGGKTLSPVAEWKYSDGSRFYSPSSFHRLIRHSTGNLYWIGNICAEPPSGNWPRYPLVIGEVDNATGALKRDTITAIDDRRPGQSAELQLSSFSVLENRETHDLELHLTMYGQQEGNKNWATADNYKYTLTIK